jgi:hypothetical protein
MSLMFKTRTSMRLYPYNNAVWGATRLYGLLLEGNNLIK